MTPSSTRRGLSRRALLARALAAPLLMPTLRLGAGVTMTSLAAGALPTMANAADCGGGPRSLVCLFLAGGADTFNLVVPSDARYATYRATRGDMAVGEADLVDTAVTSDGPLAVHAGLPTFQRLMAAGRLAVVGNVGPLIRPTTQADYRAGISLPESLYAHNTQQKLWQTAAARVSGASGFGWGGALAEHLAACNAGARVPAAFSMAGDNAWQSARDARYTSLNPNIAIQRLFGHDAGVATWIAESSRVPVAERLARLFRHAEGSDSIMAREAAAAVDASLSAADALDGALDSLAGRAPFDSWQPDATNRLETQLALVARLIAVRETLGLQRQLFFVQMGGWDTHSNQNERFPVLLDELERSVMPYQQAIDDLGVADSVTTFTATDFGRTLTSNGNGTDHGWGGHALVFGGAVAGGELYGRLPSYARTANPDEADDGRGFAGRLIPSVSVNQYGATLARWMGVDESALDGVFPDLSAFARRDLGFMRG